MLKVIISETDPQPEGRDPQVGPSLVSSFFLEPPQFLLPSTPLSILVLDLRGFRTLTSLS